MKTTIVVNGTPVVVEGRDIEIKIEGDVANLKALQASVTCGDVHGDVDAGGSVKCGNVGQSVDAGGSVDCHAVHGDIDAGSSVKCGEVAGSVDAGGSVKMDSTKVLRLKRVLEATETKLDTAKSDLLSARDKLASAEVYGDGTAEELYPWRKFERPKRQED